MVPVRTDIGRQAEEIVAAGGLLPDEMMLDLITTRLQTLKENVGVFSSPLCNVWFTCAFIELDPRWLPAHTATGKAAGRFPRVSRAAFAGMSIC